MTARGDMAGHPVSFVDGAWRYADGLVALPDRECHHCGLTPEPCYVPIPADLSHTGSEYWTDKPVDACIVGIVRALNLGTVKTRSSCCGHGQRPGQILLADGRKLIIEPEVGENL
jgi:hypothetical protein